MVGRSGVMSPILIAAIFLASTIHSQALAYECDVTPNVSYYPGIPPDAYASGKTAAQKLIMAAKYTIANPKTEYKHQCRIDGLFMKDGHTGLYLTDCSCFINYLLYYVATKHYKEVYDAYGDRSIRPPVPRAHNYWAFFKALQSGAIHSKRWRRVTNIATLRPGDLLAWSLVDSRNQRILPTEQLAEDTGHVMIVAAVPQPAEDGSYLVPVYDSSSVSHFDFNSTKKKVNRDGVGEGRIKIFVNGEGTPTGYQFCPYPDCIPIQSDQIAAARMESLR